MLRTLLRTVSVAFSLPLLLTLAGTGASAGTTVPEVARRTVAHWATFQGAVSSDGRSGIAGDNVGTPTVEGGTCTDAGTGLTNTSCSVSWSVDKSICTYAEGDVTNGFATYTSSQNDAVEVPLMGAGTLGSGLLAGRFAGVDGTSVRVVHIVIDAGSYCGAAMLLSDLALMSTEVAAARKATSFSGTVDLI